MHRVLNRDRNWDDRNFIGSSRKMREKYPKLKVIFHSWRPNLDPEIPGTFKFLVFESGLGTDCDSWFVS